MSASGPKPAIGACLLLERCTMLPLCINSASRQFIRGTAGSAAGLEGRTSPRSPVACGSCPARIRSALPLPAPCGCPRGCAARGRAEDGFLLLKKLLHPHHREVARVLDAAVAELPPRHGRGPVLRRWTASKGKRSCPCPCLSRSATRHPERG